MYTLVSYAKPSDPSLYNTTSTRYAERLSNMSKSKGKAPVREKNEYIPQFIVQKPFYIDNDVEGDYRTCYLILHNIYS